MSWKNMKVKQKWEWVPEELPESTEELENPARGWLEIYTFQAENGIDPLELRWSLRAGETLALVLINIGDYRDCALDDTALENIRSMLSFFMQYQKDVILRPVYDTEGKGREREPDKFDTVLTHIRQIGELLQQTEHSVCIFQGLLVGSWGEMHDSRYLSEQHLRKLYDTLEPYLGSEVYLAVRTPAIWRILTDEEQFQRGDMGKTAMFDDGILGSMTHLGMFGTMTRDAAGWKAAWTRKEELEFLDRITKDVPCGGEVVENVDGESFDCKDVIKELKAMHLTYLNCAHDRRVLDNWKSVNLKTEDVWREHNLYDYAGSHLGYRFIVRKVEIKKCLSGKFRLEIEIENTGFAAPFQEMELLLVLQSEDKVWEYPVEFDAKRCCSGEKNKIIQYFCPRESQVFLKLRRKKDGRPVRFANRTKADCLLLGSLHQIEK